MNWPVTASRRHSSVAVMADWAAGRAVRPTAVASPIVIAPAAAAAGIGGSLTAAIEGDGRPCAVARRHGEGQPRADAADPHAGRQPARPAERPTVSPEAQPGGQAADRAHDCAGQHAAEL
jgi:hypothetical protein